MTKTWHTPQTWTSNQLVTDTNLNEQIRDNMETLYNPPTTRNNVDHSPDYTTTNTSFADVDISVGTFSLSLPLDAAADVLVSFNGLVGTSTTAQSVLFDITVDGTRQATNDGITGARSGASESATKLPVSFVWLLPALAQGTHTINLQWRTTTGTATLYAGAGTTGLDVHPQFAAIKV